MKRWTIPIVLILVSLVTYGIYRKNEQTAELVGNQPITNNESSLRDNIIREQLKRTEMKTGTNRQDERRKEKINHIEEKLEISRFPPPDDFMKDTEKLLKIVVPEVQKANTGIIKSPEPSSYPRYQMPEPNAVYYSPLDAAPSRER